MAPPGLVSWWRAEDVGAGQPSVLTFDDLPTTLDGNNWVVIPNGYGGLQWNNFAVLNGLNRPVTEGYRTGTVSPANIAFSLFGDPASLSKTTPFTLSSAYLTAAFVNGLQIQVRGWAGSTLIYNNAYTLNTTAPTLINFNYVGVDRVTFTPAVHSGFFAVDNLVIQAVNYVLDSADGNHGAFFNGATSAAGEVGQAFSFDGINDFVRIPRSANLDVGNQVTVEFWMKADPSNALNSYQGLVTSDFYGIEIANGYALGPLGVNFFVSTDGGATVSPLSYPDTATVNGGGAVITAGQWHHIAGTYDGAKLQLYIDGQPWGNPNFHTGAISPMRTNSFVTIGAEDGRTVCPVCVGSRYFNGLIDEPAIYHRALSVSEIAAIYAAGSAGKCASSPPPACVVPAAGLLSWWRGEGNALDSAGGNHGTPNSATPFSPAGIAGQAFRFNGLADKLDLGDPPNLRLTNSFTIEGWILASNPPTGPHSQILFRGDTRHCLDPYYFSLQPSRAIRLHIAADEVLLNPCGVDLESAPVPLNQWLHVAGVLDGASGSMSIFIDGVLAAQMNTSVRPFAELDPAFTPAVVIGNTIGFTDQGFNGLIDELAIYNRALAAAEIQAIYAAGSAGKCMVSTPPSPVPPVIVSQPTNVTVYVGSNATFRVIATGDAPLSYRWYFGDNHLAGGTSSVLSLTNVQLYYAGPYSVVVSNAGGVVTSYYAVLTVKPLPNCVPPPAGLVSWWRAENDSTDNWDSNNATNSRGFTAGKVGQAFIAGGMGVPDSPSLRLTNALTIEAWVRPTTISLSQVQTIVSKFDYPAKQPTGTQSAYLLGVTNNGRMFFTVSATGAPLTNTTLVTTQTLSLLQWSFVVATYDGAALRIYLNGVLAGQANYSAGIFPGEAALGIGSIPVDAPFPFRDFIWPFAGLLDEVSLYNRALTGEEILAIFNADLVGKCLVAPTIVTQPQDQAVPLGEDVKFTVSVLGSRPLRYQWRVGSATTYYGTPIPGATNSALVLEKVKTNQAGLHYLVEVTNAAGFAFSAIASLNLLPAPTCTDTPTDLISWWPFDGNSADTMGTNNAMLLETALYVTGKVDRAASFNGINSRIGVNNSPSLNFGSNADFSIEMWIKAAASNSVNPNVPLFEKKDGSTSWIGYSLSLNQGRLAFAMGSSPLSATNVSSFISPGPDLRDAMFHHVAVSVNRTATNGGNLYVDGQVVLNFNPTPRKGSLIAGIPLYLGAPSSTTSNSFFGGLIDEPALYNRALTASEILAIRQAGAAGKCKVKPAILVQPVSQRVTIGSNVTFSVTAAGTPLLRYQWLRSGGPIIPPATNSTYGFVVQPSAAVTYSVRVTNLFGSITSSNVVLTINHVPTALPQAVSLNEDTPTPITLIGSDPDRDPLSYPVVTPPAHGALSGTGSNVVYTPSPNYNGPDSFTFKVNDGLVDSAPATISLTVRPVNDAPVAEIVLAPLSHLPGVTNLLVIAPVGTNAMVVLDGSRSTDVENDPLQYFWSEGTNTFATGVLATNRFAPGLHTITLVVSDGQATGTNSVVLEVRSPAQAVGTLIDLVENADLGGRNANPLLASLQSAAASFARGNATAGINELEAFQNKVRAQIAPLDPALAAALIEAAQEIIDVLSAPTTAPRATGNRLADPTRLAGGKFQMRFNGPHGRPYFIEASRDLTTWEIIGVARDAGQNLFDFEDVHAAQFPGRFYRVASP